MKTTARNYAAQAERSLKELVTKSFEEYDFKNDPSLKDDIKSIVHMANTISTAVHFAIPDDGIMLDTDKSALTGMIWRLPFPIITIEYYSELEKALLLVEEFSGNLYIAVCTKAHGEEFWVPEPIIIVFDQKEFEHVKSISDRKPSKIEIGNHLIETSRRLNLSDEQLSKRTIQFTAPLGAFLEALTCSNVTMGTLESIDEKKAKHRAKAGKLPIYETKILMVNTPTKSVSKVKQSGSHASPKQHLRRGHIRRYPTYNIWINHCVVGKSENGIISKSYEVR